MTVQCVEHDVAPHRDPVLGQHGQLGGDERPHEGLQHGGEIAPLRAIGHEQKIPVDIRYACAYDVRMQITSDGDIVALDAQAVRASVDLVAQATVADLSLPTPCADWTLRDLLTHMVAQHDGFAAASTGDDDLARWQLRPLGDDPVVAYRIAADHVLAAFAADGVLGRTFPLPESTIGSHFSARQAISFHFIDYVVHSWDVARTLGLHLHFPPALLDVALRVAESVPDGDARLKPGAPFAPVIEWTGTSTLDRILALLGRSPTWQPPSRRPDPSRAIGSLPPRRVG